VAERFELIGLIDALEQRRYKSGEPIEGLWGVKLRTDGGIRSCSFNSTVPKDWGNPSGERRPHPDFSILQQAMATQEPVRIKGTVARKGDLTYQNGTRAEIVANQAPVSVRPERGASDKKAPAVPMDDAKWAVSVAAEQVGLEQADSVDEVQSMAAALLLVAQELSEEGPGGVMDVGTTPDNVRDIGDRRRAHER
jgi:hypothetical protein